MMEGQMAGAVFWVFVAVVVVARIWQEVAMRREAETTIHLAIERGQPLDPLVVDRLLRPTSDRAAWRGGAVVLAVGLGLPIMGYFLSLGGKTDAMYPLMGVGALLVLIGAALLTERWYTRRTELRADTNSRPPA